MPMNQLKAEVSQDEHVGVEVFFLYFLILQYILHIHQSEKYLIGKINSHQNEMYFSGSSWCQFLPYLAYGITQNNKKMN